MVIPSLIGRAFGGERPLKVWGDGSPRRDFIFSRDVARGMMLAMEKLPGQPVNLGSGRGTSIRELVETILRVLGRAGEEVVWDASKPSGDAVRIMDISRARADRASSRRSTWSRASARRSSGTAAMPRPPAGKRYDVFR
jgi:GDP-L-fucose synthase